MTSNFSNFTARLRKFIHGQVHSDVAGTSMERENQPSFKELARELFALQFTANRPYAEFSRGRGVTPDNLTEWAAVPAVPTAAFKEWELSCLAPEDRIRVFHSSGTTAQRPSRHFHNAESLEIYEASLLPWFARHVMSADAFGDGIPDKTFHVLALTPDGAAAPHSSLVHMFETVRRAGRFSKFTFVGKIGADGGWELDFEKLRAELDDTRDNSTPILLLGTAFSFVNFADWIEATGQSWKLPPGSRVMETGGYKGRSRELPKADLHRLISLRLGVPPTHIVCEYGMSELSSQAYDQSVDGGEKSNPLQIGRNRMLKSLPISRAFQFPPWARAQIVSPETNREVAEGETGLVRVFDLANTFSVMAVQTEDLGIRRGNGFELVGRATLAEPRGCSLMALDIV